jgi:hypothetical protein
MNLNNNEAGGRVGPPIKFSYVRQLMNLHNNEAGRRVGPPL